MVNGRHLNAVEILPEDLLLQISELVDGRALTLWLPSRETINRQKRNDYVATLAEQGFTAAAIADRLFISDRQVRRILKKHRAASYSSRSETEENCR